MVVCRAQGLGGTRIKIVARTGHITISLTIVATFCSLVIVMLGSVLTVNFLAGLRNTRSLVGELATQSSGFVTDELRDHLDPVVEQANWVADLVEQDSFDTEEERVSHFLIGAFGGLSQVTSLAFFSKDHRVVQAYRDKAGGRWELYVGSPRDPDIVEQTLRTGRSRQKGFWNRILFSELTNRSYINYVRPVRRGDEFLGVVMAAVSLNELSEIVSEISEKRRGTVFILSEKDQVVAHPNLTSEHPELSKATPTVGIGRVGDPVLEEFWLATTRPIKGVESG